MTRTTPRESVKRIAKPAKTFASRAAFRAWLEEHHAQARELLVRCFKTKAKEKGLRYADALDEALCLGWIDGVRRGLDETSFSVRFSPRRARSAWSAVNIERVGQLKSAGRMHAAGLAAFETRVKSAYSYENKKPVALAPPLLKKFQANTAGWRFFAAQPPWYRRICAFYVMSAKRPETRVRRLEALISRSERHESLPPLKLPKVPRAGHAGGNR